MNDTNLISAEAALRALPDSSDVRAGLAGYAEWCGSPLVLTDAVELIDQQAQRIAGLESARDKLCELIQKMRQQQDLRFLLQLDASNTIQGTHVVAYVADRDARTFPTQAVPEGWRPATEDPTDGGLYWVLIGDQPHVARFSNRTSTARWWSAYGIPRAVAEEPTHWMPIPDAPEHKA